MLCWYIIYKTTLITYLNNIVNNMSIFNTVKFRNDFNIHAYFYNFIYLYLI